VRLTADGWEEMHHAVDRLGERLGELLGIDLAGPRRSTRTRRAPE